MATTRPVRGREQDAAGGRMAGPRPEDVTRVVLRPIASPLPLGFLALFVASLLASALQLRWVPVAQSHTLAIAVLAFVVPLQLIACLYGFLCRDVVAGTGVGLLAGTWATFGVTLLTSEPGVPSPGLGILLVVAAGALLVPTVAALTSKLAASLVLAAAAVRFAISGGYELTSSSGWRFAAGVAGVVVAGLALYGALASELDSATKRSVLPLLRLARGKRAVSGQLGDQVQGVAHEAGVRQQL